MVYVLSASRYVAAAAAPSSGDLHLRGRALSRSYLSLPRAAAAARQAPRVSPASLASRSRFFPCTATRHVVFATDVDVEEAWLELEDDLIQRMEKCIESVKSNFATIRTGRATPNMLDRVQVEYYGEMTPIKSVAGISVPDSSTLSIQPFDMGAMADIERAILQSDLDLTPNNDGKIIRIKIPSLTEERRKEMVKKAGALAEDGKVAIRNVRRDSMKAVGKLDASEDFVKDMEADIQKMTDKSIKQVEEIFAAKTKELTTV